jgi:hypothetical protein
MTKMDKCLAGVGIASLALLVFGLAAVKSPDSSKVLEMPLQTVSAPVHQRVSGFVPGPPVQSAQQVSASSPVVAENNPLPANATSIPDDRLLHLSTLVNLAGARDQQPEKNQWTQALPVAQKLLDGPCDCAQRIWLKHFVEMGNYALSDSTGQYHETAKLMATLGRNDGEAMALSHKPN